MKLNRIIRFKMIFKFGIFIAGLLMLSPIALSKIVLDLPGKDSSSKYHVIVKKDTALYEVTVSQVTGPGKSEVIYESSSLIKISAKNADEYRDDHIRVIDRKNGSGVFILNNGSEIRADLKD